MSQFTFINVPDLTGYLAFTALVAAPVMRGRTGILVLQLAAGVFFALHYSALGVAAACLSNALGSVQTLLAIFAPRNRYLNNIGWIMVPVLIAVAIIFWSGPTSILSCAAMSFIAVGRMQRNELSLRVLVLIGGFFWMCHDYLIDAWIALAADIFCAAVGILVLFLRIGHLWKPMPGQRPS